MPKISHASSSVKDTQRTVNKATINNIQQCPSVTDVQQITITGNHDLLENIVQVQNAETNAGCFFSAANQQALQNAITADLTASANAQGSAMWGMFDGGIFADSHVDVHVIQEAVNQATVNNIQKCGNVLNRQGINITGNYDTIDGAVQEQNNRSVVSCFFKADNEQALTNNLHATVVASAISGKLSMGGIILYLIIAAIAIGGLFVIVKLWPRKGKTTTAAPKAAFTKK